MLRRPDRVPGFGRARRRNRHPMSQARRLLVLRWVIVGVWAALLTARIIVVSTTPDADLTYFGVAEVAVIGAGLLVIAGAVLRGWSLRRRHEDEALALAIRRIDPTVWLVPAAPTPELRASVAAVRPDVALGHGSPGPSARPRRHCGNSRNAEPPDCSSSGGAGWCTSGSRTCTATAARGRSRCTTSGPTTRPRWRPSSSARHRVPDGCSAGAPDGAARGRPRARAHRGLTARLRARAAGTDHTRAAGRTTPASGGTDEKTEGPADDGAFRVERASGSRAPARPRGGRRPTTACGRCRPCRCAGRCARRRSRAVPG